MGKAKIYIGNTEYKKTDKQADGEFVNLKDEGFYKINNYNKMPPFLMSLVSAYDHWFFISSNGALSAGRTDKENALFPYYTDDKIQDSADITGSKTIIFALKNGRHYLWEPFSSKYEGIYNTQANLYKSLTGNTLIFEEINKDLKLKFTYKWQTGEQFGFIRSTKLINLSENATDIIILDGIQNILPANVDSGMQNNFSTLVDAYKKSELLKKHKTGIYYLSSIPTDKAEPREGLKANTVWVQGIKKAKILLSSVQLDSFRKTAEAEQETDIRAQRGAYFIKTSFTLQAKKQKKWKITAEVNQDLCDIEYLKQQLDSSSDMGAILDKDAKQNTNKLQKIVGSADGIQHSADKTGTTRHFANTLFNLMRGGVIKDRNGINTGNYRLHIESSNKQVFEKEQDFLSSLPDFIPYNKLLEKAKQRLKPDILRLTYEYLPLVFGRRHGDPSRPWNLFSIKLKEEDGRTLYRYEGNWRDIFQNWEALAISFPDYIESMVAKFVNASTADGYNPYRISSNGIDWEKEEAGNLWSNIGYWGDHQIIYLQKLLELSHKYHPGKLSDLLDKEIFSFADIPYRIKSYEEICQNPYETIVFDHKKQKQINDLQAETGSDAKLKHTSKGEVFKVNLLEKLLLSFFTKMSNFVPEAGIWLNTQRPEWNDANNALVGNGASMVTLYYMRRYAAFLIELLENTKITKIKISKELFHFFESLDEIYKNFLPATEKNFTDKERKAFTDKVGNAGSIYRESVYERLSYNPKVLSIKQVVKFLTISLKFIEHSTAYNQRNDKLYHAYNLIHFDFEEKSLKVSHLYEMLEGQVAVLSSGYLSPKQGLKVLDALKSSAMFRKDQNSYMLYPDKNLNQFVEKNTIPQSFAKQSVLLKKLTENENQELVKKDCKGQYHFNPDIHNAKELGEILEKLSSQNYSKLIKKEEQSILEIWEQLFNHHAFTGRSGTFFKYEGLGSIYWHMVSKLLLAVAELFFKAYKYGADMATKDRIAEHYYEIKAGIANNKSPKLYGAFPTDPYSHTPAHAGAQQAGMTGQVKEDFISRFFELGVVVESGIINFEPALLRNSEFLRQEKKLNYFDKNRNKQTLALQIGEMAFSFCGLPVIYKKSQSEQIRIEFADGKTRFTKGNKLPQNISKQVFKRSKEILKITVYTKPNLK